MKRTIIMIIMALAIAASAQDKATAKVTFYRYREGYGALRQPSIYCDNKEIARMTNGRFFSVDVPAGKHVFQSSEKQNGFELEMKPGQEYFVRFEMGRPGIFKNAKGQIYLVAPEQAKFEISKLKPIDADHVKN